MRLRVTIHYQPSVSLKINNLEYYYIIFFPWLFCIFLRRLEVSVVALVIHGTTMVVANNWYPMCSISIIESINNMVGHSRMISCCTLFKTFFCNCYCKSKCSWSISTSMIITSSWLNFKHFSFFIYHSPFLLAIVNVMKNA